MKLMLCDYSQEWHCRAPRGARELKQVLCGAGYGAEIVAPHAGRVN